MGVGITRRSAPLTGINGMQRNYNVKMLACLALPETMVYYSSIESATRRRDEMTRDYIKILTRNAALYRGLYGQGE